jgi:peptidyl-prolyl cis-trans isomerase C
MRAELARYCCTSLASLMIAALAGCGSGAGDDRIIQLADPGPTVETVNGLPVPQRLLDAVARSHNWDLSKPELRERALKELTNHVIAAQVARDQNFASDPDFAAAAELNRLQGLAAATAAEFQKRAQVDDSVLRAEYDKQLAKAGSTEYDFAHIVFATEPEAIKAAGEVLAGKPFDAMFEAHKEDARQARAFTHIRSAQLPEQVAAALASMKAGDTTKVPIETKFGWHVMHLTAVKPYTPPPFEQVKDNLRRSLVKRSGDEQLAKLRESAKVTLTDPAPPAAAKSPAAPASEPKEPAADASKPKD